MREIQHSGCKLLLASRMFVAMAASILAQFVFMSCVILLTNLNVMHPLSWIRDTWTIITCFRMWCYFAILAAVILLQGVVCSKNYLSATPCVMSRFETLCAMFTPQNFVVGSLNATIGILSVWLHLSLEGGDYSRLSTPCKTTRGSCLVEEHNFLLLSGLWTGIYHFFRANFSEFPFVRFPIIPQSKIVIARREIAAMLPLTGVAALWPVLYFLGLYYFVGAYFREFVLSTLFLQAESEPLDGLSRLLNFSLIFHAWVYAALFILTTNTMHLLFEACLTERTPFEINPKTTFVNENQSVTLAEALAMEKIPIMQQLGYLDLLAVAQKDKARRGLLFALSQPGGHPYNWNCIVESCLGLVKKFVTEINNVSCAKPEIAAAQPVANVFEKTYAYHMRNLTASPVANNEQEQTKQDAPSEQLIAGYLRSKRESFVNYLLSKPLIFYFFGKQADSKIRHALTKGQTVIWAVESISTLAVVSLTEDSYGIAQKDLPAIIETLLSLKQCLEKLQKTNLLMRKPQNDDKAIRIALNSLRSAIKRSLYRIVANFKIYIDDLPLEPTVRDQLQSFIAYRE